MVINHLDPKPASPPDGNSTIFTAATPPETAAAGVLDDLDPLNDSGAIPSSSSSIPWPGSSYLIRDTASGHLLTLLDGQVVLAPAGSPGAAHWACVDNRGWLGFRNVVSGKFLGYDSGGKLRCTAEQQREWENFCVRLRPCGRFVMLMSHWISLWPVGVKVERGGERLAKLADGVEGGLAWEFVKVSA